MNKKFEDKRGWKESNELVLAIYKLLNGIPKEEYEDPFSLTNEIKNTVIKIPSKLMAGYELGGDYLTENLIIARGLLMKLESQLTIASDVKLIEEDSAQKLKKRARSVWELLGV